MLRNTTNLYRRYRISDDAESEAPSPDSLASSPRSCASTPRSATSRPATPRERVQHQIALNQQKRRMRRQVGHIRLAGRSSSITSSGCSARSDGTCLLVGNANWDFTTMGSVRL